MTDELKDTAALADDMFNDESTKPQSSWFKFEKVGDSIAGILVAEPYEKNGDYGMQTLYTLETPDGSEVIVTQKNTSNLRNIKMLRQAVVGDYIAFKYVKDVDTGKGNLAKSIDVRIRPANRA